MPDTNHISRASVQAAWKQGAELSAEARAHIQTCEACREAWLDAALTASLEEKPPVNIPPDFAARVVANVPAEYRVKRPWPHWGLLTASLLVAALMIVTGLTHARSVDTLVGQVFVLLVATEIAGIALWLGWRTSS